MANSRTSRTTTPRRSRWEFGKVADCVTVAMSVRPADSFAAPPDQKPGDDLPCQHQASDEVQRPSRGAENVPGVCRALQIDQSRPGGRRAGVEDGQRPARVLIEHDAAAAARRAIL